MQFGFVFFARDLGATTSVVKLGEDLGFDLIGLADSPANALDPFVGLSLAARATSRVRLGPTVTNPLTRHPLIIANLAAGLEQLAPGRSFLGLGTGNSGVRHAGAGVARLDTLTSAIGVIRRLLAGEMVESGDAQLVLNFSRMRVPILIAGSGPRTLRLAGQIADTVFLNLGVLPEVVADGLRWVREGAEAAGRNPDDVECWVFVPGAIREDARQAIDEVKGAAVGIANYVLRGDPVEKRVPPAVQGKVAQLLREYEYRVHLTPGPTTNYHLADRLGIADYLLDRFTIAGSPDDCRRKVDTLRTVGVENVCFSVSAAPDVAAYVRLFGETLLAAQPRPTPQ